MATVDTSSSIAGTSSKASVATDAYSSLTSGDFVKIILSEISRQDPLKPNDSGQLVQDLSNIRSIQSSVDLQSKLTSLVEQNQSTTASGLIGKGVSGLDQNNQRVEGIVTSVSNTKNGPILNLDSGARVEFKNADTLIDRNLGQTDLAFAATLIGKQVTGRDGSDNPFSGVVRTVTQTGAGPVLTVNVGNGTDKRVSLFNVTSIEQPLP